MILLAPEHEIRPAAPCSTQWPRPSAGDTGERRHVRERKKPVLLRDAEGPARAHRPTAASRRDLGRSREAIILDAQDEVAGPLIQALARLAALAIFALCGAIIFTLRWENVDFYWYRPLLNAYSIGVASFLLSRFAIALFYRPPKDCGIEPSVSVVITAFNEEEAILRTVACCYGADYPRDKLEVIVVDDGSTDGTVRELERARRCWPDLIVERFRRNRGKREAMAAGARCAKGEILLYVDSDSFVRRNGIRKIVQGFADPTVAAVSGHTDVVNAHTNSSSPACRTCATTSRSGS